jgi:hypothetical protein
METLDIPAIRGGVNVELGRYRVESGSSTNDTQNDSNGRVTHSSHSQAPIAAELHVSPPGNGGRNNVQELRGVHRLTGLEPTGLKYARKSVITSGRLRLTRAGVASVNAMST